MIRGKKGQVFLMAAVIIVGLIFGASRGLNVAKAGNNNEAFYDLADEIGFETKRVLDYGVINTLQGNYLEDFLDNYKNYIGDEEVLYIYGDINGVNGLVYANQILGVVGINSGGIASEITIRESTSQKAFVAQNGNLVTVQIRGIDYKFNLKQGQNFYFVIIKGDGNERFVVAQ
jgi:hypothetical protein